MRILSQDGMIDVPYENFVFSIIKDNYIVATRDAVARPPEIVQGVVARYSTKTKARKAMEMLREVYIEKTDPILKFTKEMTSFSGGNGIVYFQFPADEDVEGIKLRNSVTYTHENGYSAVLYGNSSMSVIKDGKEVLHTGFRKANTEKEVMNLLANMPAFWETMRDGLDVF